MPFPPKEPREGLEAAAIGAIGGAVGLAASWAITTAINASTAAQNLELFLVTPRLVALATLFSVGLGALAGRRS